MGDTVTLIPGESRPDSQWTTTSTQFILENTQCVRTPGHVEIDRLTGSYNAYETSVVPDTCQIMGWRKMPMATGTCEKKSLERKF